MQVENIWKWARHPAFRLEIGWVKGHSGVEGNEKADEEAKEAENGRMSQACNLPSFLTEGKLPKSISVQRQAFNVVMMERWKMEWKGSPHYARISCIDPALPSQRFRKLIKGLSRAQANILTQLRMGHIPLNEYLFRIGKANYPTCAACQQDEESVHQYLFDCMAWKHEHWHMGRKLGNKAKSLKCVLGSKKGVEETLKFIGHTGQLKCTFSDVSPS